MPFATFQYLGCFLCFRKRPLITEADPIVNERTYEKPGDASSTSSSLQEKEFFSKKDNLTVEETHAIPRYNRGLAVIAKRKYAILDTCLFPTLKHEKEVIISTRVVGLNPIDWKSVDYNFCLPEFPWIIGREMAGVVESVGRDVTNLKVGQRVWTSTYYRDSRAGCFQEYVTVPAHTVSPIPQHISFEEASCLGVAGLTAIMTLWRWLEVSGSPIIEKQTIPRGGYLLIWGGASVTAHFAIQIASLAGLKVIAVAAEKSRSSIIKLGCAHVVSRDEKSGQQILAEIRAIGGDNITRGIDLVGPTTADFCLQALSTTQKALFAPLAMISSKSTVPANITVETVEMKKFVLEENSCIYSAALNKFVEEGKVVLPSIEVLEGGLDVIVDGLNRIKLGEFAGKRVVVRL